MEEEGGSCQAAKVEGHEGLYPTYTCGCWRRREGAGKVEGHEGLYPTYTWGSAEGL